MPEDDPGKIGRARAVCARAGRARAARRRLPADDSGRDAEDDSKEKEG